MEYPSDGYEDTDTGSGGNLLAQIPNILWHRKWWIIVPAVLGTIAALLAVLLIPEKYTSQAIMLVEAPQLPEGVLGLDQNDIIDRRIARIRQQITSRPDLIAMIERHSLYGDRRGNDPLSAILSDMRDSIAITPTLASGGSSRDAQTIAFSLSFTYDEPTTSQAVAQDLMERILQLDARGNVEQATNTVDFLADRATQLEESIREIENEIALVKARDGLSLSSGGMILSGGGANYDVQILGLQRDNQMLLAQKRAATEADTGSPMVVAAENNLAAVRSLYSETHPDVVIAKRRLEEARRIAQEKGPSDLVVGTIDRQIEFNRSQIAALQAARAREQSQMDAQMSAQARAPMVQQQVTNLERRLEGYAQQYEQVSEQLSAARAEVKAEDEQMTERLAVVEPPVIPDTPSWPNHLLILGIGIGGGLALGLGLGLLIEIFQRPIRDPASLEMLLDAAPLGVIPTIASAEVKASNDEEPTGFFARWKKKRAA